MASGFLLLALVWDLCFGEPWCTVQFKNNNKKEKNIKIQLYHALFKDILGEPICRARFWDCKAFLAPRTGLPCACRGLAFPSESSMVMSQMRSHGWELQLPLLNQLSWLWPKPQQHPHHSGQALSLPGQPLGWCFVSLLPLGRFSIPLFSQKAIRGLRGDAGNRKEGEGPVLGFPAMGWVRCWAGEQSKKKLTMPFPAGKWTAIVRKAFQRRKLLHCLWWFIYCKAAFSLMCCDIKHFQ